MSDNLQDAVFDAVENPPAEPEPCDHAWASHHEPGHRIHWVRQCMICHAVDWDDLDDQIAAVTVEREKFRAVLSREKVEWMIHAFDLIDTLMVAKGIETSGEVQDDLRKLADLLDPPVPCTCPDDCELEH